MAVATTKNIQVRVDEALKNQVDSIFAEMGMDTTTGIRVFLNRVAKLKAMPFRVEVLDENGFTAQDRKELDEAIAEVERGEYYGPFKNMKEMFAELDKNAEEYDNAING